MRKEVPMIITALSALAAVFGNFFWLGHHWGVMDLLDNWFNRSFAFAALIGVVNLSIIHINAIRRRKENWVYSLILLIAMYGYAILGLIQTTDGPQASWIYNNVLTPLDATVFALLAFYITSASYRAFRARTVEATVLLVTAIVVMLGVAPIGAVLFTSKISSLAQWLLNYANAGTYRAFSIAGSLGAMATALRITLGLERAHLGGAQ